MKCLTTTCIITYQKHKGGLNKANVTYNLEMHLCVITGTTSPDFSSKRIENMNRYILNKLLNMPNQSYNLDGKQIKACLRYNIPPYIIFFFKKKSTIIPSTPKNLQANFCS